MNCLQIFSLIILTNKSNEIIQQNILEVGIFWNPAVVKIRTHDLAAYIAY